MSLPLMAEGEFAQVKENLEAGIRDPAAIRDILGRDKKDHYTMLVELAVLQRDEAGLRQYAPLAEELAVRDNHRLYQAIAHRAWGVLHRLTGEYALAETRLNQALELFEALETHWQIGRTYDELAELALERAKPAEAKRYYSQALASFERIGANPDSARTRQALESL